MEQNVLVLGELLPNDDVVFLDIVVGHLADLAVDMLTYSSIRKNCVGTWLPAQPELVESEFTCGQCSLFDDID